MPFKLATSFVCIWKRNIKLKFANGRIYDDLKLSNKGKMKKGKAEFHHRNAGNSSGEFLTKFNLGLTFELKTTIEL